MKFFNKSTHITSFSLLIHLHSLFFLLISIGQFPLDSHGCREQERRALLDFKLSLSDPSDRLSSWQEGSQHENCCHWHGIKCSPDTFHVILIDLRNRDLEFHLQKNPAGTPPNTALLGKLSPSLSNITRLEYLDLSLNKFQESQIPFQISALTKLTHLDLSNSNFSASISTQLTNLSLLHHLDLSCRGELFYYSTACPELSSTKWMRGLVNLQVLNLRGINLTKATSSQNNFSEHISYLSNLRYLDISQCSISTEIFPIHDFHNLSRLSSLKMSGNYIISSEIPEEIVNITSLSILDLSDCGLHGSVPSLPQLTELHVNGNRKLRPDLTKMFQHQWPKLQTLDISNTNVRGSIPSSVSNAPLLVSLSASFCSIEGSLPSSIYNLSRLQSLHLSDNSITGYIPNSICEILSLQELDLGYNNITGTIPSCLTNLHNLTVFSVSGNSIGGNVSLINFINELNLVRLDLSSNRLTVVVDQRFHLYSKFKLKYLRLTSCGMEGLFPTFICKLTHLWYLDLSQNHLTGMIPSYCVSELHISDSFNLSSNKLHGPLPLPPQAGFMSFFDLSNNKLSGEISSKSGKRLSRFSYINLAGNALSGSIHFSMFSKDSVAGSIDLSNNKFSGSIPYSICSKDWAINPRNIDLSNNNLSGIIPISIGYCTYLSSLNLGTNNLTGNVPDELGQLNSLQFLQLNDNNLDGAPLNFISKLQDLRILNLANNHFSGIIPAAFGSAIGLCILSLRSNKFHGSIPPEINYLERLQILDLSQNNLSGHIPNISGKYWRGIVNKSVDFYYPDNIQLQMVLKGIMIRFEKLYNYSSGIDLSRNMLDGNIPTDIGLLKGLATLNLSHNHLSGDIPRSVGNMSSLGSLDLSFNRFTGHIPQSLTSLDSLGVLNLSYNELSGRIPRGDHFGTLSVDGWAFVGNDLLCGEPTKKICDGDTNTSDTSRTKEAGENGQEEDVKERILFYGVIILGFGVGFWGLFFVLLLRKEQLWFPYWKIVDSYAARITNVFRDN
ncbi:hypothetical protein MKW92_022438 [Papaver armeniacum]|nr:hypothetical protein MKW92_022438 [Papaver armeniacum]